MYDVSDDALPAMPPCRCPDEKHEEILFQPLPREAPPPPPWPSAATAALRTPRLLPLQTLRLPHVRHPRRAADTGGGWVHGGVCEGVRLAG